jgi:alkylhydroperoxidase/carboxymuconolactone decarboxylase family protein YurZ
MRSRLEIRVHINRALRAGAAERKLDELALAIGELARYIEEIEKDRQRTSIPR